DDGLNAISTGVFAAVEGVERRTSEGVFLEALNIEVERDEDSDFELQGSFEPSRLAGQLIEVLGVSMMVAAGAIDDELEDCSVVEVQYRREGSGYLATEIECDDE
ncbi:MAG: hypothetical protein R6T87_13815, partial [Marinobacter sp.]